MKISTVILAAITFLSLSTSGFAGEVTTEKAPKAGAKKEAAGKPAPFDNYWDAKSWDADGASFWHTNESGTKSPKATTPKDSSKKD